MKVSAHSVVTIILNANLSEDAETHMLHNLKSVILTQEYERAERRVNLAVNRIVERIRYPYQEE